MNNMNNKQFILVEKALDYQHYNILLVDIQTMQSNIVGTANSLEEAKRQAESLRDSSDIQAEVQIPN